MFIKYNKEYNPKIDFRMIYSINPKLNLKEDYCNLRKITKGISTPKTEQEIEFHKLLSIYYILIEELISIESIEKCCEILKLKNLDSVLIDEMIGYTKSGMFNQNVIYWSTFVFWFIAKNTLFNNYTYEIAVLIFNSLLSKNKYVPIVITNNYLGFIKKNIETNITVDSLMILFSLYQDMSLRYLNKFQAITKKDIIISLLNEKQKLETDFFVSKLWLYGSFVRDEANEYSDVDLFISVTKELDKIKFSALRNHLQNVLKRSTDIQVEGKYLKEFSDNPYKERELIF